MSGGELCGRGCGEREDTKRVGPSLPDTPWSADPDLCVCSCMEKTTTSPTD